MSRTDWTNALVYQVGKDPFVLPNRFRLPNGQTRYSSNCTVDDINTAGFLGPVADKPLKDNCCDKVIWNSTSLSWEIIHDPNHQFFAERKETSELTVLLKNLIENALSDDLDTLAEGYKKKLFSFVGEAYSLIYRAENNSALISRDSVPATLEKIQTTPAEVRDAQLEFFEREKETIRYEYETSGLVTCPPTLDTTDFWENIGVPSDWILGHQLIDITSFLRNCVPPPGRELNDYIIENVMGDNPSTLPLSADET